MVSEAEFDDFEDRLYYVALGNIPVVPLSRPGLPERFVQMTLRCIFRSKMNTYSGLK
ncbi:hypothetical protein [Aeromonas caviae]|uniref:hypothetical protein n=1 Tax=Aeromonas caviae TaxID=648 RepID=UPI001F23CCF3|nr:hypothetical protein [Aeromonas caviae]